VKLQRGGVLWGGNQTEGSRDTEEKGRRGIKLTSSSKCKKSTEISRINQLLLAILPE